MLTAHTRCNSLEDSVDCLNYQARLQQMSQLAHPSLLDLPSPLHYRCQQQLLEQMERKVQAKSIVQ
jgi:hypothetical protein